MNEQNTPIRIAIADDHQIVMQGYAGLLARAGSEVTIQALNGKILLMHLERAVKLPDVIILDTKMPVMNGLDTLPILNRRWPAIAVLVLTELDAPDLVTRMLLDGAKGFLNKTCSIEQLVEALVAVHMHGVYFSDLVTRQFWQMLQSGSLKLPSLTEAEKQVLKYCWTDLTYGEIAGEIGVTTASVTGHRDSMFKKLKTHSKVGLVRYAIENGLELAAISGKRQKSS